MISFEHITIGKYLVKASNNYLSIINIDDMLSNEKYAGDSIMQKTYVEDFLTKKKVKNRGQKEQYYVKDSHQGIISREIFEEVQKEKERRNKPHPNKSNLSTYQFSLRFKKN